VFDVDTLFDEVTVHGAAPEMPLTLVEVEVGFGLVFHFKKSLRC
jgi:hypothetical protein